jgi:homocysteine S-methyltransferase
MILDLMANHPRILAECAVAERLRRTPGITLHPTLFHTPLIYGPDAAREAMADIYRGYLEIARRSRLPMLLTAPTWRLDEERVIAAGVPETILADAVDFLRRIRDAAPQDQGPVAIGGLVGPRADCYRPDLAPDTAEAAAFHHPQISKLARTGVDFLLAQTLPAVNEAAGIARVMSHTGLPYILSFCTGTDGRVLDGTPLPEAMAMIDHSVSPVSRPVGYFVNCTHPVFLLKACAPGTLDRLIGIQANGSSRDVRRLDGASATVADPIDEWAAAMHSLEEIHGVRILGGCCGTHDSHLQALAGWRATDSRSA